MAYYSNKCGQKPQFQDILTFQKYAQEFTAGHSVFKQEHGRIVLQWPEALQNLWIETMNLEEVEAQCLKKDTDGYNIQRILESVSKDIEVAKK